MLEGRGTDAPRVSHVGEIEVTAGGGHEFYDFEAKYLDDGAVALAARPTSRTTSPAEVQRLARAAFEAVGCEGLARVDFFYTDGGDVIVNEINTMPGFTPHSMYPQMWAATGLAYPELIDELIQLALHAPRRPALRSRPAPRRRAPGPPGLSGSDAPDLLPARRHGRAAKDPSLAISCATSGGWTLGGRGLGASAAGAAVGGQGLGGGAEGGQQQGLGRVGVGDQRPRSRGRVRTS